MQHAAGDVFFIYFLDSSLSFFLLFFPERFDIGTLWRHVSSKKSMIHCDLIAIRTYLETVFVHRAQSSIRIKVSARFIILDDNITVPSQPPFKTA
jgi:hypothetical protein